MQSQEQHGLFGNKMAFAWLLISVLIIVRPLANYGLPRSLRVTVGLEDENTRFLGALKKVISTP